MTCRPNCGACCIALSISSPLPGMPAGKPAGASCANLEPESRRCRIWGSPDYPQVCERFTPDSEVCGDSAQHAMQLIHTLELATR